MSRNHFMTVLGISLLGLVLRMQAQAEAERSAAAEPKANTKEVKMTNTEVEEEDPAPKIDEVVMQEVDKIDQLLDVLHATRDLPTLNAINQAAMTELVRYNTELAEAQAAAQEKYQ